MTIPGWLPAPTSAPAVELPLPEPYDVTYEDTSAPGRVGSVIAPNFGGIEESHTNAFRGFLVRIRQTMTHQSGLIDYIG